jgi:hypothetical protein
MVPEWLHSVADGKISEAITGRRLNDPLIDG